MKNFKVFTKNCWFSYGITPRTLCAILEIESACQSKAALDQVVDFWLLFRITQRTLCATLIFKRVFESVGQAKAALDVVAPPILNNSLCKKKGSWPI